MLKIILHQLWNQRRQNGWIFFELLLVGFFLWTVIDPLAVLVGTKCIPNGYESDHRYVVRLNAYDQSNTLYNQEFADDSIGTATYVRIMDELRQMPEVESYAIVTGASFPNSSSFNGGSLWPDSVSQKKNEGRIGIQYYTYVASDESNLFKTYGIKDANTGGEVNVSEDSYEKLFISEYIAKQIFGTTNVVGKKVSFGSREEVEIAGVFQNYKHREYEYPAPTVVEMTRRMGKGPYLHWRFLFTLKLKDGVDCEAFEKRFHEEVAPLLKQGNFYLHSLTPFKRLADEFAQQSGTTNKLRLQYALAAFALFSVFLGMLGTFWIRCNARRQEIGVMRSMGASKQSILFQFLLEAALLVTIAYLLIIGPLAGYMSTEGMYSAIGNSGVKDTAYWMNRPVAHFVVVSVISYLVLLLTALIGTYIPVYKSSNILPADALRDEQ